ncbi:hypothetical protein [Aureimonas leprariae]|uniref:Uncharacterized protein n=1 Tax=Plantimonas leprariae TaxID=2615207 RepID=A0A7V7U1Q2_9HYPH|nr:hypothetical protein [Aureimonas leprariae]KAB0682523.1 hypothetical protein F6X38_00050 [Aureimonas leprariae]
MIASVLVFALGALAATLAALLLAPLLWRKAQDFARREYDATLPATANEIRAEFDVVRAAAAMDVRRGEVEVAAMRERLGLAQAELGRANVEIAALGKRNRDAAAEMASFSAERDNFREIFAAHRDKERALSETLDEAKRDGSLNAEELEALAVRFREVSDLAEERKVELVAAETKIERLTDTLRSVERASGEKDTLIRLLRRDGDSQRESAATAGSSGAKRAAGLVPGMLAARNAAPPPTPAATAEPLPSPAEPATPPPPALASPSALAETGLDAALERTRGGGELSEAEAEGLRDRIAAVAAGVIHRTAVREGPGSPLEPLLRPAGDTPSGPHRSIADRVRALAAGRDETQPSDAPPRAE